MFCGHCMMDVPEKAKFCMRCGTKVGEMTCETCGAALPNGSRFCKECGVRLGANGERLFTVTFDKILFGQPLPTIRIVWDGCEHYALPDGGILPIYTSGGRHNCRIHKGKMWFPQEDIFEQSYTITQDTTIKIIFDNFGHMNTEVFP